MVDNKVQSVGDRQNFQKIQKFAGNVNTIKLITNNMGGGTLSLNDETLKTLIKSILKEEKRTKTSHFIIFIIYEFLYRIIKSK